jgi:hypothetical protein
MCRAFQVMKKASKNPTRCHKCIRKAVHKLVDKWYCGKCFAGLIEQKIRQNLRKYGLKKDCRLLVTDKASEHVVRRVINIPVQIVKGKQKADFIVIPWTMDDENEEFLSMLFSNKSIVVRENKRIVKLFYPVSKKDMKKYFGLKKVHYQAEKTEINSMLDTLEEKYPGTKRSLLRSEERLRGIL